MNAVPRPAAQHQTNSPTGPTSSPGPAGHESGEERTVDPEAVARAVLAARSVRTGRPQPSPERVSLKTWTPDSARKARRRTFVQVDVDSRPVAVAKVPLSPEDPKLARELQVLRGFGANPPVGSPRPLDVCCGGFSMSHLPGVDLPSAIDAEAGPEALWKLVRPAVDRVVELHRIAPDPETARSLSDPVEAAAQYVREPLFGVEHADAALRGALLAPTHGDLGPWNVRHEMGTGRSRVLDFEDYREVGVAAMDVVNLLVTCALPVFSEYGERGFDWLYERAFAADHWFSSVLLRGLAHYATATGQTAGRVIDLLPLTCQWLIERIEAEGRDTSRLFYRTFRDRYLDRRPSCVGVLDD